MLDPTIIYVITGRSKIGTKFLCYCGSMVGTLVPAADGGEKILLYQARLRVPFEVWAAKELRGLASSSSQESAAKVITERPTIESMCKKEKEIELGISDLAQSLLDGVLGC